MKTGIISKMAAWTLVPASLLFSQIVALEPEQAGPDFPFQGEFSGETVGAGGAKQVLVAQVSAYGNGSFRGVLYPGGFPGAPGHLASGRVQIMGTRSGEKVSFSGQSYVLSIAGNGLTGTGPNQTTVNMTKVTRSSPTLGAKPPQDAVILYDGKGVTAWRAGAPVDARGLLGVPATTTARYGDYSLHLEVLLPFEPSGRGQARGNSGIIMNTGGFSEIQVLESIGDVPYQDGCGALFGAAKPLYEANLPPLTWQTYDVNFDAPAAAGGNAIVTVRVNGVVVQNKTVLGNRPISTTIELQDHHHQVFYRNIWLVPRADYETPATTGLISSREAFKARTERLVLRNGKLSGGAMQPAPAALWNGMLHDITGRRSIALPSHAQRVPAPATALVPGSNP